MKLKYTDDPHAYYLDGKRAKGVTTVAKIPDNTYNLELWAKRMVAVGLASDPRLLEQVAAHLTDKKKLDDICEDAMEAAKAHHAADAGTTAHRITEVHDTGEAHIETELSAQVTATWTRTLDDGGYEVVDGLVERIAVHPDHRICGTFDRILRRKADGRLFIADLKTGAKAIDYPHSIAVQLAVYANAPLIAGPLNGKGETTEFEPFPDVDKDVGIVIHMPTPDHAELVEFDIAAGHDAFHSIILPTLAWRDRKDLVSVSHGHGATGTKAAGIAVPAATVASVERISPPVDPAPVAKGETASHTVSPAQPSETWIEVAEQEHGITHDRRSWLVSRVRALSDTGRKILAAQWPDTVPTFKQSDAHTDQQLHWIEQAIIKAEAEVDAPFNPTPTPPVTRHTPADPFDGLSGQAWDEGGSVHQDDADALRVLLDADSQVRTQIEVWARQCHDDGNRSLSLKQKRTRWRYSVVSALLHAARAGCDDWGLRELAYGATGTQVCLTPDIPLGLIIASLTIAEADCLAHLARHYGSLALQVTYDDQGTPVFFGPAWDGNTNTVTADLRIVPDDAA